MSIKDYLSKRALEASVREQNLIHELVVINQLLVEAADKLQNEANKIPQLQKQIDQLQTELKQAQQEQPNIADKSAHLLNQSSLDVNIDRIERARFEAEQQKSTCNFSTLMQEKTIISAQKNPTKEVISETLASLLKL